MADFYTPEQRSAYNRSRYLARRDELQAYWEGRFFYTRSKRPKFNATAGELWRLWHKQRGRCALTEIRLSRATAHLDHRVPRAKGGVDTIDNLQWVHKMANRAKNMGTDEEVMQFFAQVSEPALRKRYGTHYIIPFIRRFS